MTQARKLYDIFFEGCTHYAIAKINSSGNLAYYTVEGIPTLDVIDQHLRGEIVIGAYTVLPGNMVRWLAFDVDSKADLEQAKVIARKLCDFLNGISYAIEWSGNKGYHILIFFKKPVPAVEAKKVGEAIRDHLQLPKSGNPHVEVFPKQDRLTDSNPLGNLLRLPLGMHPVTHSWTIFVDPYNGWEEGPERDPSKILDLRVDIEQLKGLVTESDPFTKIVNLLLPYWTDGQRHNMALYTAGYLASLGWTEEAVGTLVSTLGDMVGDGDINNQLECVEDTFRKVYDGKTVSGFAGLSDMLHSSVLQELTSLASTQTFSATLQVIDRIRLGKGASFQKVRTAAKTIVSHLKENGMLVQDGNWIYWLDGETRELYSIGNAQWEVLLHSKFGLNPAESFGKQATLSVKFFAEKEAQWVSVHKRAFWDVIRRRLLLNLGGPEVYVLTGDPSKRYIIQNGEEGMLFLNTEDGLNLPDLLNADIVAVSALTFLTQDLSFMAGSDVVSATPEQQSELLKAWILSTFFSEAMPTRPILTILAPSGAGKSTAARRILKLLEGLEEDVLGIVADKPDALRASLAVHKILCLDNLEKLKAHWLTDVLNRVSTGSHIEVRTLYKTNDMQKIVPNCFVIITATNMPFSEETVFTRMLPIELSPLKAKIPESRMQSNLVNNYLGLWKGMMDELDEVVAELRNPEEVAAPTESRLADFTVFCATIQNAACLKGEELMGGLRSMVSRQERVLKESSTFVQTLEIWMRTRSDDAHSWNSITELHSKLGRIASTNRIEWRWQTSQGLSRHVSALEDMLKADYGLKIRVRRDNGREIKEYLFEKDLTETAA